MAAPGDPVVLAGDIGGTNCRLNLYSVPACDDPTKPICDTISHHTLFGKTYKNEGVRSFADILIEFFHDAGVSAENVAAACIAVAGPVKDDRVTFTNLGWVICGRSLEAEFGIPRVKLINDFVAVGYGLLTLHESQYKVLQEGELDHDAPMVCIGAGTGLGEVFLTRNGAMHSAYASEGGHKEYSPRNELEIELLRFLQKKVNGRVSVERVVSGKGLMNVYEFLRERFPDEVDEAKDRTIMAEPSEGARWVSEYKYDYPLCATAMKLLIRAYGTETGNLALQYLPFGGLYITQAIVLKNLEFFLAESSGFMAAYRDKGRVTPFVDRIPVRIALVDDLGMKGAHVVAGRLVRELKASGGAAAKGVAAVALPGAASGGLLLAALAAIAGVLLLRPRL